MLRGWFAAGSPKGSDDEDETGIDSKRSDSAGTLGGSGGRSGGRSGGGSEQERPGRLSEGSNSNSINSSNSNAVDADARTSPSSWKSNLAQLGRTVPQLPAHWRPTVGGQKKQQGQRRRRTPLQREWSQQNHFNLQQQNGASTRYLDGNVPRVSITESRN